MVEYSQANSGVNMNKKGILIVFSGPSGVGKGTVLKKFINDENLKLSYSVSMTTRPKRNGEIEGINYFYVSKDEFKKAIEEQKLLEYAYFVGNYYGTPIDNVNRLLNEGKNVLLEIEVQGALQVMEKVKDALTIFIVPPSMEELEKRIRGRNTETEEVIKERLDKAKLEMTMLNKYKYVVCNDDPEKAALTISNIIKRSME